MICSRCEQTYNVNAEKKRSITSLGCDIYQAASVHARQIFMSMAAVPVYVPMMFAASMQDMRTDVPSCLVTGVS